MMKQLLFSGLLIIYDYHVLHSSEDTYVLSHQRGAGRVWLLWTPAARRRGDEGMEWLKCINKLLFFLNYFYIHCFQFFIYLLIFDDHLASFKSDPNQISAFTLYTIHLRQTTQVRHTVPENLRQKMKVICKGCR